MSPPISIFQDRTIQKLFGCMSLLGIACGLVGIAYVNHANQKIRRQSFYKEAFEMLHKNGAAIALLGPPIKVNNPSLGDGKNIFTSNQVTLHVPIKGQNVSAIFNIDASLHETKWRLDQLSLQLDCKLMDKKIVIYRHKSSTTSCD